METYKQLYDLEFMMALLSFPIHNTPNQMQDKLNITQAATTIYIKIYRGDIKIYN